MREKLSKLDRPIRVGVSGAGWIGSGFVKAVSHVPNMTVNVLADEDGSGRVGMNRHEQRYVRYFPELAWLAFKLDKLPGRPEMNFATWWRLKFFFALVWIQKRFALASACRLAATWPCMSPSDSVRR